MATEPPPPARPAGQSVPRVTAAEAHLSRAQQVRIVLRTIAANGGVAPISDIYQAIEEELRGARLSLQGRATLRELVNRHAVNLGYVHKHDPKKPGWRITPEGRRLLRNYLRTPLFVAQPPSAVHSPAFRTPEGGRATVLR